MQFLATHLRNTMIRVIFKYQFVCCLLVALWSIGCVERRISIFSDPPGAQVVLDGKSIGTTPVSTKFYFYGNRDITLYKQGYQTETQIEQISPPVYQWFPLDFVSEFLWPAVVVDERRFTYTLAPHVPLPVEEKKNLTMRAQKMRERTANLQLGN